MGRPSRLSFVTTGLRARHITADRPPLHFNVIGSVPSPTLRPADAPVQGHAAARHPLGELGIAHAPNDLAVMANPGHPIRKEDP